MYFKGMGVFMQLKLASVSKMSVSNEYSLDEYWVTNVNKSIMQIMIVPISMPWHEVNGNLTSSFPRSFPLSNPLPPPPPLRAYSEHIGKKWCIIGTLDERNIIRDIIIILDVIIDSTETTVDVFCINRFSSRTDVIRHILTSVDVRFWRIKTTPALKEFKYL